MSIKFEDTLLDTSISDKNVESNLFLIFNKRFDSTNIINQLKTSFPTILYDKNIDNYSRVLQMLIANNERRICATLNTLTLFSSFSKTNILLISYTNINGKNYINGLALLDIFYRISTIEITYICSDLQYKYIGKNIITFLKILCIHLFSDLSQIILKSVANTNTQNFYRSQHFSYFPEMQVLQNASSRYNYKWSYNKDDLEDIYDIQSFHLPFLIEKTRENKYSKGQPRLMEEPHIFMPYKRSSQIIYEAKAGKRNVTKKGIIKKRKFISKRRRTSRKNK